MKYEATNSDDSEMLFSDYIGWEALYSILVFYYIPT
jgi:hypothetical protein